VGKPKTLEALPESVADWSDKSYALGILRPDGEHVGKWNPLSREDLMVLYKVLTTKLPLRHGDGHLEMVCAADESEALENLAKWAGIVADWMRRNGL
jgi:hypothetical protein